MDFHSKEDRFVIFDPYSLMVLYSEEIQIK